MHHTVRAGMLSNEVCKNTSIRGATPPKQFSQVAWSGATCYIKRAMLTRPPDNPAAHALRAVLGIFVFALVIALYRGTHDPAGPIKWLVTDAAIAVAACLGMASVLLGGDAPRLRAPGTVLVMLLLGVYILAALASPLREYALTQVKPLLSLTLLTVLASQAYRLPGQAFKLFACIVCAMGLASLYGFYQTTGLPDPFPWAQTNVEEYRGLPSTFANPNFAAHALLIALLLGMGTVTRFWWLLPPGLLVAFHLYFTDARGSRVALAAALVLALVNLWARHRSQRPVRAASLALALTLAIGALGAGLAATTQYMREDTPLPLDGSLVLRYNGYYGASNMVLDRPVLGFGPGVYSLANAAYWTDYEQQWYAESTRKNMHVHNDLLETAIDAGIPAAALYLALFAWVILRSLIMSGHESRDHRRLGFTLAAVFLAIAVDGLFGFNLRVPVSAVFFFLLVGVLAGTSRETPAPPRAAAMTACAVLLLVAFANAYAGTRYFRAERQFQMADSACYWASQFERQGEHERAEVQTAAAKEALRIGQELLPADPRFPGYMAYVAMREGKYAEAAEHLAYVHKPMMADVQGMSRMARAYVNLATQAQASGNTEAFHHYAQITETALQRLQSWCPPLPAYWEARALLTRAQALDAEARNRPARALWQAAGDQFGTALVQGAPMDGRLERLRAEALLQAEDWPAASESLTRAAEIAPQEPAIWALFHRFALQSHEYDAFLRELNRAWDQLRGDVTANRAVLTRIAWLRGVAHREAGQEQRASNVLCDALEVLPESGLVWGEFSASLPPAERLSALCTLSKSLVASHGVDTPGKASAFDPLALVYALCGADAAALQDTAQRIVAHARARYAVGTPEDVRREISWLGDLVTQAFAPAGLSPAQVGALLPYLGETFLLSERWDAADQALAFAEKQGPQEERAMVDALRSEALAHLGQPEAALALAKAAAKDNNQIFVRHMYARRLKEAGRTAEANFEYSVLLREVPRGYLHARALRDEYAALQGPTP